MSAIFQRPLCEMGAAYDYALRPFAGDAPPGTGGPCDDYPRSVELCAADEDPTSPSARFRAFSLCPEHEAQLRRSDGSLAARGIPSRFRAPGAGAPPPRG